MPKPVKFEKLVKTCLTMSNQVKLSHWMAQKYGQHLALDKLYTSLDEHIDMLIEVYLGATKMQIKKLDTTLNLHIDLKEIDKALSSFVHQLIKLRKDFSGMSNVQNIIDEMLSDVNRAQYLIAQA